MAIDRVTTEYVDVIVGQAEAVPSVRTTTEYVEVLVSQASAVPLVRTTTTYIEVIVKNPKPSQAYWGVLLN